MRFTFGEATFNYGVGSVTVHDAERDMVHCTLRGVGVGVGELLASVVDLTDVLNAWDSLGFGERDKVEARQVAAEHLWYTWGVPLPSTDEFYTNTFGVHPAESAVR